MTIGPLHTVARGEASQIAGARRVVVRTVSEWHDLWDEHAGGDVPAPGVDFDSRMVAAVFAGERPTPGFEVAITDTRREGAALVLQVEERHPSASAIVAQVITSPFHIVTLPRYDGDVRFAAADSGGKPQVAARTHAPDPNQPRRRHDPAPSSTGLSPQIAAVLAYLAGPFSGALLLATERTSRFVKFHAWQALIGLGALGVAAVLFLLLAFGLLLVSPAAFWTMLWLAAITALSWLVVWAACLVQAYKGRVWKLPIAGAYAERWAFPRAGQSL